MKNEDEIAVRYADMVSAGELEFDSVQAAAAQRLDGVAGSLAERARAQPGLLSALFGREEKPIAKGLYFHGGVGRGKTMLMDLFFAAIDFQPKRRLHFHQFMAEAHDRIGAARKHVDGDPIPTVAAEIAESAQLLCFDELHVTDIADAMVVGRLFRQLFEKGVVVVATSNAAPDELYRHGLNRQLFLPFIDLVSKYMDVFELESAKDYRRDKLAGGELYVHPVDDNARRTLDQHWLRLTGSEKGRSQALQFKGRTLEVRQAARGCARFSFAELCEKPLGTLDYLQIAQNFHTVLIDGIPLLTPEHRNEARRFINLIDTLYDARTCLIASAAAEPDALYQRGDGADLFQRTASRLSEMRSEAYLEMRGERGAEAEGAAAVPL